MEYTWMQIIWLFFIYSLAGWVAEVSLAVIHKRKFINRGFISGPLCPIYGFASVLFALFLPELKDNLFFLFLGGVVLATVLEYITGLFMEKIFHRKLWDYSNIKWNLDGYICVRYSLIWGLFSLLMILVLNPLLCGLVGFIPRVVSIILLWTLSIIVFIDFITTFMAVLGMKKQAAQLVQITESMRDTSKFLENALTKSIQKRMQKSFPAIDLDTLVQHKTEKVKSMDTARPKVFASGCSFYKLTTLFFVGAFLGDIVETIFCYFTMDKLMSRSSVVYGPFSIVWGLGCAILTALLYRYKDKSSFTIFIFGTVLGGAYEYICSVFTEIAFGTIFWDYSGFTFNLGGRINLLYCFFWGFAAIAWLKFLYPMLSKLIEKIPLRPGIIISNCMIVFMLFNMAISGLALARYTERNTAIQEAAAVSAPSPVQDSVNKFLDSRFHDERMERVYPNAKIVPK